MSGKEKIKAELTHLLQHAKHAAAAREALVVLFPKLGNILDLPTSEYVEDRGRAPKRRIAKSDFAKSYFQLSPDQTIWSKSQSDALALANPKMAFQAFQERFASTPANNRPKLRRVFIDLLSSIISQNPSSRQDWFMALIDNARVLLNEPPAKDVGLFDLSIDAQITMLLSDILKPLDLNDRGHIIGGAISHAVDISFLCDIFRLFVGDKEAAGNAGGKEDAFGENTDALRERLTARVRSVAESGALYSQVRPQDILWFWWGAGHGVEVREHTTRAMEDKSRLDSLLSICVSRVLSTEGSYDHVDQKSWSKIVNLDELKRIATAIVKNPDDFSYTTAQRFLTALSRYDKSDFE